MRSFQVLLLLGIFLISAFAIFSTQAGEDPRDEARKFLSKIQSGDFDSALREFGDNTCHCAPRGGYIAYLQYEAAQEPNLAFLKGQSFKFGPMRVKRLPYNKEKYILPWDKPEDVAVYVPLEFDDPARSPYFLPLDMAYGYNMPESEFNKFLLNPEPDWWKGFSLRLRSSLLPGVIKPADTRKPESEADIISTRNILPAELTRYLHPADAAAVTSSLGQTIPAAAAGSKLPRLKSILIGLKIVRRGTISRWAVKKLAIDEPALLVDGKEIQLSRQAPPPDITSDKPPP